LAGLTQVLWEAGRAESLLLSAPNVNSFDIARYGQDMGRFQAQLATEASYRSPHRGCALRGLQAAL
jgi:hypothetical protein